MTPKAKEIGDALKLAMSIAIEHKIRGILDLCPNASKGEKKALREACWLTVYELARKKTP